LQRIAARQHDGPPRRTGALRGGERDITSDKP
jgi:hypothetical protein